MTSINNKIKRDEQIVIRCTSEEKENLQKQCQKEGLNVTTFFRLCMREAELNGISLRLEIPNALTAKTIRKGASGKSFTNIDDLMDDLNA